MLADLAVWSFICAASIPVQRVGPDDPLQPTAFASPSGTWSIEINPSERFGAGPGEYSLHRAGQAIWTKTLPFTMRQALVDDEGFIAGYGYSMGWSSMAARGEFFVALVSPVGDVIARHARPVEGSREIHGLPDPQVSDLFLDVEHQRFVLRIEDSHLEQDGEQWRVHQLRTGDLLAAFQPAVHAEPPEERIQRILHARPIPGRDLYALYWWIPNYRGEPNSDDVRLSVIDLRGSPAWSLDLPGELDARAEHADLSLWKRIERVAGSSNSLISVEDEGRFSAWLLKSGMRAEFELEQEQDGTSWRGVELSREPVGDATVEAVPLPPVETVTLELLGEVILEAGVAANTGPIHDITAFGFDELGRIMLARADDNDKKQYSCLLLDDSGKVLLERAFAPLELEADGKVEWWPFESGRWLVTCSPWATQARSQAWWADPASGDLEPLSEWDFPSVDAVASTRDGGFAVLGTLKSEYTRSEVLARCDAKGNSSWHIVQDGYRGEPSELLSTDDLAVTSGGLLVLADPIRDVLMLFKPDGKWQANLDLAALWGEDPGYPSSVRAGSSGHLVVIASSSDKPVRVVDADGHLRKALLPRLEDGSKESVLPHLVQIAPDGRLWTTDRRVLLRLGDDGVADRTLGSRADKGSLHEPGSVLIDPLGRVVIQDRRTHALHAFDRKGQHLFVAIPETTDFGGRAPYPNRLACGGDGSLYARTDALAGGWLRFGPDGERMGAADLGAREVVFQPRSELRWAKHGPHGDVAQLDGAGSVRLRLTRRQDRRWFEQVAMPGVSATGQAALVERHKVGKHGVSLSLFAADGSPSELWSLPTESSPREVLYTSRWILLAERDGAILMVSTEDGRSKRFVHESAAGGRKEQMIVGASPDGNELWLVQTEPLRLTRYALP